MGWLVDVFSDLFGSSELVQVPIVKLNCEILVNSLRLLNQTNVKSHIELVLFGYLGRYVWF